MEIPGEKLLTKLWETIADKGIGSLLKPWQIRREGLTSINIKRIESLSAAQTEVDAEAIRLGKKILLPDGTLANKPSQDFDILFPHRREPSLLPYIEQVAQNNFHAEIIRKEISLAKAVMYAENELAQDSEHPSDKSISEDWLLRWRNYASDVSSKELQEIWGRVLAGEVKNPGQYSLRTLDFIRNISKEEAQSIEHISQFIVIELLVNIEKELNNFGLNLDKLLEIEELGIISGATSLGVQSALSSISKEKFLRVIKTPSKILIVRHDEPSKEFKLSGYPLTKTGQEVLRLIKYNTNEEFLRKVGLHIKNQGFEVAIADYKTIEAGKLQSINEEKI